MNPNALAVDHTKDVDLISATWFSGGQDAVMRELFSMQRQGWRITPNGLMTEGDNGPVVARPLKVKGKDQFTGIGFWRIDPFDFDN